MLGKTCYLIASAVFVRAPTATTLEDLLAERFFEPPTSAIGVHPGAGRCIDGADREQLLLSSRQQVVGFRSNEMWC